MARFFEGQRRYQGDNWFRQHSLSLILAAILIAQFTIAWFTGLPEWYSQQQHSGEQVGVDIGYIWHWLYDNTVSLLADTYGALLLVLFSKWFYEKGSAESKDQDPQQDG